MVLSLSQTLITLKVQAGASPPPKKNRPGRGMPPPPVYAPADRQTEIMIHKKGAPKVVVIYTREAEMYVTVR